jgi:uncharacterized protein (TIGR02246 family)
MNSEQNTVIPTDEQAIYALYYQLIAGWNERNGAAYGNCFSEDGAVIGFDGSQMNGKTEIVATLAAIFADHVTAPYIGKVKSVHLLAPDVALLRAIAGMIPVAHPDFNPHLHTIQTLIATKTDGQWGITLFQNTPAQFHGRADLVEAMTQELREVKAESL